MADSTITVRGTLTRDPELRFTQGGKAVASSSIAVNHRYKKGDDWEDEDATFYNLTVWDQVAENFAQSAQKGDRVVVTGRPRIRKWETNEGDERQSLEIAVDEIGMSLRFATAEMTRLSRERVEGAGTSKRRAAKPAAKASSGESFDYSDEEPF